MPEFLFELGTEEIPARMLGKAVRDFKVALSQCLTQNNLQHDAMIAEGAPRQISIYCRDIQLRQDDRTETVTGPPVRIAYDEEGNPSRALQGFLRKNPTISSESIYHKTMPKGDIVAADLHVPGQPTHAILADAIPRILSQMHFAKNMRWGKGTCLFVRPVRNILALLDGEVIAFEFGGVKSGRSSFGLRFHGEQSFEVADIDDYLRKKKANHIAIGHTERVARIEQQIQYHLDSVGGRIIEDNHLLQEVADLVESPLVILGTFDELFLEVPREILVTSLREHQKSFCVQDRGGNLMPYFLSVANVPADYDGLIKQGNEWVLKARLWDAKFFWDSDCKKDLADLRLKLEQLMFQRELGSYLRKSKRMAHVAQWAASELCWDPDKSSELVQAAELAKSDLMSELVFEFPELQGVTGGLLLKTKGYPEGVWRGVYDHYLPTSFEGAMPVSESGAMISLIDKADTLLGCFGVGLIPTGTKDPYALRRAAQGMVRILNEFELPISLSELLRVVGSSYGDAIQVDDELETKIHDFFADRVRHMLKKSGFDHALREAVVTVGFDRVDQVYQRATAIAEKQKDPSFRSLALNLKRMKNVVADELDRLSEFDVSLLDHPAEKQLWSMFKTFKNEFDDCVASGRYSKSMELMAQLAQPVEDYFAPGGVFVNVEDERLRLNRKSMIHTIQETLLKLGDISFLEAKS